jgi:hypothetical protein
MSACSSYFFRSCADHVRHFPDINVRAERSARPSRPVRRNATNPAEPLAPFNGAAAFFIARRRAGNTRRAFVKEPIEKQANRHH